MATPTAIVGYLALFASVGFVFLFVNLLVGKLLRPVEPNDEKLEVYECGEPTIGSSFVQFDLRFYVVALLFIIFDVEIAFFFPWATVFGKATHLMDPSLEKTVAASGDLAPHAADIYRELGVENPTLANTLGDVAGGVDPAAAIETAATNLAWIAVADIGVFFAVLLVGFAYVWKRGDLDWVRAVSRRLDAEVGEVRPGVPSEKEPVLSR